MDLLFVRSCGPKDPNVGDVANDRNKIQEKENIGL